MLRRTSIKSANFLQATLVSKGVPFYLSYNSSNYLTPTKNIYSNSFQDAKKRFFTSEFENADLLGDWEKLSNLNKFMVAAHINNIAVFHPELILYQGLSHVVMGNNERALELLKKAKNLEPNRPETDRLIALHEKGDLKKLFDKIQTAEEFSNQLNELKEIEQPKECDHPKPR